MDRRIKKTRTAIYDAYMQIKRNHPNEKPSVKEVCAVADINKTTFYRYFPDIDNLVVSIIDEVVNYCLIRNINVEDLLTQPEIYFKNIIERYKNYEADFNRLFIDDPNVFVFEAEKLIKSELIKTVGNKYDEILLSFIVGGATRFFSMINYYDNTNLDKFCRIIRAVVSAI